MTKSSVSLKVVSSKKLKPAPEPTCVVKMDYETERFGEFVVFGFNEETGHVRMIHNADALTMGESLNMLTRAFYKELERLPEDIRNGILSYMEAVK